jgi:beta-glucosidase
MNRIKPRYFLLVISIFILTACDSESDMSLKQQDVFIEELLKNMTLEEKVGQMTNIGLTALCQGDFWTGTDSLELDTTKLKRLLGKYKVGSVQNKGQYPPDLDEWKRLTSLIQLFNLNEIENKIPLLFGIDAVHGAHYTLGSTMFPQQLALAATWNTELAYGTGKITAYELRASGIPWNYAPCLDIATDPLWGRFFETFGEDPFLVSSMGRALIKGHQGDDLSNSQSAAVCIKHFIGYGSAENGKDRANAILPESYLRNYHLPPFKEAIDAGAGAVMLSSGAVNGIPGHANKYLITDVLKGELGFKGLVISDWADIDKLIDVHRVAADKKDAARMAVLAGMDMCMVPYDASFAEDVLALVSEGEIPLSRIDDAVTRILNLKKDLGLFDEPAKLQYDQFASEEYTDASYKAAAECITLLKNEDDCLPFSKEERILVCGPAANSMNFINGGWSRSWGGDDERFNDESKLTIYQAISAEFGADQVKWNEGANLNELKNIDESLELANWATKIVVCLGEKPATEKPSDIEELELEAAQLELVKKLSETGKDLVTILVFARPRIIREIVEVSDAILMAYLPGDEGGRAISSVISGEINPSGKLPFTYPRYSGDTWTYNHKQGDEVGNDFGMDGFNPQWEFGTGLSYTTFESKITSISTEELIGSDTLILKVNVKNIGPISGKEVVQLYMSDRIASVSPDMKRLIAFQKIDLEAGTDMNIEFIISANDLSFINNENKRVTEDGLFHLTTGGNPGQMEMIEINYKRNK